MSANELKYFLGTWEHEAKQTEKLLAALPDSQYDFRPYPECRSIGEMAWHLAEIDAYLATGIASGKIDFSAKLPGLERPREVKALAPGYRRVHDESRARLAALDPAAIEATVDFIGRPMRAGDILWGGLLYHTIHHRGQLAMMTRMAGGKPPGLYGPNLEEMTEMRKAMAAKS